MAKRKDTKYIVIHCTACSQNATVQSILNYWRYNLKWSNPGYFALIDPLGAIHFLAEQDDITNGAKSHNHNSVHVSYIGGVDEENNSIDNRTDKQKQSLKRLVLALKNDYPGARVLGHRDFPGVAKMCPSFDVKVWYAAIVAKNAIDRIEE